MWSHFLQKRFPFFSGKCAPRQARGSPPLSLPPTRYCRPMPHKVRIALDAMGGDHGAAVVVPGAEVSLARHPDTEFVLFGDRAVVQPLLASRPRLPAAP